MPRYCSPRTTIRETAVRALRAASMCPVQRPFAPVDLGNESIKGHEWLPPSIWSRPLN